MEILHIQYFTFCSQHFWFGIFKQTLLVWQNLKISLQKIPAVGQHHYIIQRDRMGDKEIKASALVYGSFTRCKTVKKRNHSRSQWLVWWTPLAGDHLHEFKAAVVQLNVRGVVVLRVDLARPERATVFGLKRRKMRGSQIGFREFKSEETFSRMQKERLGTLYMLLVFFLGLVSYTNWHENGEKRRGWKPAG